MRRAVVEFAPEALFGLSSRSSPEALNGRGLSAKLATELIAVALNKAHPFVEARVRTLLTRRQHDLDRAYRALDSEHRQSWESAIPQSAPGDVSTQTPGGTTLRAWVERRDEAAAEIGQDHIVSVTVEPIELRRLVLPVVVCALRLTQRQASSTLPVVWNPLTKEFDPIPCTRCGVDTYTLGATKSAHPSCAQCIR